MIRITNEGAIDAINALREAANHSEINGYKDDATRMRKLGKDLEDRLQEPDHDATVINKIYQALKNGLARNRFSGTDMIRQLMEAVMSPSELRKLGTEPGELYCFRCYEKLTSGEVVTFHRYNDSAAALMCSSCSEPNMIKCPSCRVPKDAQTAMHKLILRVKATCSCSGKRGEPLLPKKKPGLVAGMRLGDLPTGQGNPGPPAPAVIGVDIETPMPIDAWVQINRAAANQLMADAIAPPPRVFNWPGRRGAPAQNAPIDNIGTENREE